MRWTGRPAGLVVAERRHDAATDVVKSAVSIRSVISREGLNTRAV